jgi:hypothetical protein
MVALFAGTPRAEAKQNPNAALPTAVRIYAGEDQSRFEVTGFESHNASQSDLVVSWLKPSIKDSIDVHPNGRFEVIINMEGAPGHPTNQDYEAYALGRRIADLDSRITLNTANIPTDPELEKSFKLKYWREKHYRVTFALVRGMTTAGLLTTSLMITAAHPLALTLPIGIAAGTMSFFVQKHIRGFNDWTERTGKLASLLGYRNTDLAPRIIHGSESYMRWFLAQLVFTAVVKVAMNGAGIASDFESLSTAVFSAKHVFWTAALSTFAQGTWDRVITTTRHRAESLLKKSPNQIEFQTNLKYLAAAMISTVLLSMQFDIPYAHFGYITMGAVGLGAYARTISANRKLLKQGHDVMVERARRPKLSCEIIINRL